MSLPVKTFKFTTKELASSEDLMMKKYQITDKTELRWSPLNYFLLCWLMYSSVETRSEVGSHASFSLSTEHLESAPDQVQKRKHWCFYEEPVRVKLMYKNRKDQAGMDFLHEGKLCHRHCALWPEADAESDLTNKHVCLCEKQNAVWMKARVRWNEYWLEALTYSQSDCLH